MKEMKDIIIIIIYDKFQETRNKGRCLAEMHYIHQCFTFGEMDLCLHCGLDSFKYRMKGVANQ